MVKTILFPSTVQIANRISADTSIDNVDIVFGIFGQQVVCGEMHVAEPERSVCRIKPVGVRDTISDE